jgi:ketosteroid isomerase-like protein
VTERDPMVQELLDKQAIREAVMRYCRGADRGDADLLASAYFPDATDDHPGGQHFTGDTIGPEMVGNLNRSFVSTNHQITTQTIEVDGDTAASESYSLGNHVMKDGRRLRTLVRYLDRFERRDGDWRITYRLCLNDATEVMPPDDGPGLGPPSPGRRDRTDPSYGFLGA